MQRRVTAPLVALEHPDVMRGDLDLKAAVASIDGVRTRGKGKYKRQADNQQVDLELPSIGGDIEGSWLSTLGDDVAGSGMPALDEDPRAAALRAIIAQGTGQPALPPPSDNSEFRTRTPMPDDAVPRTLMDADDVKPLPLNAFHGLVYSQFFSRTTVSDLKDILSNFGDEQVLHTLDELCVLGVVEVPLR